MISAKMLDVAERKPLVVSAPAELDIHSAPLFRDDLALLLSHGVCSIVVDMAEVTFLDSSGMGALLAAQKLVLEREGRFVLQDVSPKIMGTLRVAGLGEHFEATVLDAPH